MEAWWAFLFVPFSLPGEGRGQGLKAKTGARMNLPLAGE